LEETALGSRALQRLAELVVRLLGASATRISLLGDAETVVSGAGLAPGLIGVQTPLETSPAALVAAGEGPLVLPDARQDPRVADLPLVVEGRVGAFLGLPLAGFDGGTVGSLVVTDRRVRTWSDGDVALARRMADSVATELELSALAREFEAHRLRFELAIDAAEIAAASCSRPAAPS
jgi:GAF domain-containing protein